MNLKIMKKSHFIIQVMILLIYVEVLTLIQLDNFKIWHIKSIV